MSKRPGQIVAMLGMVLMMLGATDASSRVDRIGHKMICVCSCSQVLLECNHVGCPESGHMINELQAQVANGDPDSAIFKWFETKYGAIVLAAPMRGGFDNVAWIAPFAVFLLATVGTAVLVTVWKRRTDRMLVAAARRQNESSSGRAGSRDVRERIRREMEL
ncbi:MAG: hypothetical protein NVSMB3_08300 [Acidobacteriaceae bacterium]